MITQMSYNIVFSSRNVDFVRCDFLLELLCVIENVCYQSTMSWSLEEKDCQQRFVDSIGFQDSVIIHVRAK